MVDVSILELPRDDYPCTPSQVVAVFGAVQAHHGYLFANARGTRLKLLANDGFGV